MKLNYATDIAALLPSQRLVFYELLAHNLTISVRVVWDNDELSDAEKVEQLKWINEVMHIATGKIRRTRLDLPRSTEAETWEEIRHWAVQNMDSAGHIDWAIKMSYTAATSAE